MLQIQFSISKALLKLNEYDVLNMRFKVIPVFRNFQDLAAVK